MTARSVKSSELGAQLLDLTKKTKEKWYHTCKHDLRLCLMGIAVTAVSLLSIIEKEGFPTYNTSPNWEKGEARDSGQLFNTSIDRVKIEKRHVVSHYLDELPGKKCQFRSQIGVKSPTKGFPQMGPWHHVGATMEITLDKKWILNWIRRELNPKHAKQKR